MMDVKALEVIADFQDVPRGELEWLAAHSEVRHLNVGERFYTQGDPADALHLILAGSLQLVRREAGQEVNSFLADPGEISGVLPFSRMKNYGASAVALRETQVAELKAAHFPELHNCAPVLLETLVHEMLDRTQEYTRVGAQREKLMSLGTMSAGLAHELNNPASAAKRAAQNLRETLQAFDEHSSQILGPVIFKQFSEDNDPFRPLYDQMTLDGDNLSAMERSDLEDELGDWLDEQGVEHPWEVAATLVTGGLLREVMVEVAQALKPEQVRNFLEWTPRGVEMRLLAQELIESTTRISDLVGAMKAYTYMDQGLEKQEVNIHEGIINTLTILKHKWQKKGVQLEKQFEELPDVPAYGSELNQVWTNLLSNAIDAVDEGGKITIRTTFDKGVEVVCVDIIDDGSGIPREIQSRIFEPFFTTKGVGEGTGMGLDIANRIVRQRHMGTLQLESRPGYTCFRVRLPLGA